MSIKLGSHAAPATLVLLAVVLAVAVVALTALSRADAAPKQLSCGTTITTDTTLDSDLVDCTHHGIVIGADDLTLDLNGHTITGDGDKTKPCPKDEFCDSGVLNEGHDGVTVRDGAVRGFANGVAVFKARATRLLDIASTRNIFFGFFVLDSARSRVRDSSGSDNIPPEGDGMGVFFSHGLRIVDNTFRNNHGPGIHVDGSNGNLIKGNLFSHSGPGVLIGGDRGSDRGDRNEVRGNRFVRNGEGIVVGPGSRNVLTRNHFSRDGSGIQIGKGRHNLVARNVVADPRSRGISIGLDFADGTSIRAVDNIIRRNVVKGSAGDGFLVNAGGNNLLRRNVASEAQEDGFDVEVRSTKLTKNRARHNADLGIDAVKGVIDGGGNVARHNGDRRQCRHIACN
jgi:large repetitive protein